MANTFIGGISLTPALIRDLADLCPVEIAFKLCFRSKNLDGFLSKSRSIAIDILLIDPANFQAIDFSRLQSWIRQSPSANVLAVTWNPSGHGVHHLLSMGCKCLFDLNYVDDFPRVVNAVKNGDTILQKNVSDLYQEFIKRANPPPLKLLLTKNEEFHLQMICSGMTGREIANKIFRSPRTVEKQRQRLYEKFGVKNKEQLIMKAACLLQVDEIG